MRCCSTAGLLWLRNVTLRAAAHQQQKGAYCTNSTPYRLVWVSPCQTARLPHMVGLLQEALSCKMLYSLLSARKQASTMEEKGQFHGASVAGKRYPKLAELENDLAM